MFLAHVQMTWYVLASNMYTLQGSCIQDVKNQGKVYCSKSYSLKGGSGGMPPKEYHPLYNTCSEVHHVCVPMTLGKLKKCNDQGRLMTTKRQLI